MSELDTFAVVELMGHRRTVGRVTEATIAGGEFIRVDATPLGVEQEGPTVMFYRPAAIYSITPVTEEVARREASGTDVRPDWWWKHVRPSVCAISGPSDDDDGYEDTPDVVCPHGCGFDEVCDNCDDLLPFSDPEVDPVQEDILAELD